MANWYKIQTVNVSANLQSILFYLTGITALDKDIIIRRLKIAGIKEKVSVLMGLHKESCGYSAFILLL